MDLPSKVHPTLAKEALDEFFSSERWRRRAKEYRWTLRRLDDITVIAKLRIAGDEDAFFTLRLTCDYYPTHPPDVRFVNPDTLVFDPQVDAHHLPILSAPYCAIHTIYSGFPASYPYGPQLVCSSMTLGYYFSGHTPTSEQLWTPDRHNVGSSLYAVHKGLRSEFYQGRQPRQIQ